MIMKSASDRDVRSTLTDNICERLELPRPGKVKTTFESFDEYYNSFAALVAEETRHTIATALEKILENTDAGNSGSSGKKVTIRFSNLATEQSKWDRSNKYFEVWTQEPLSHNNRNDLRAGAVVAMTRKGDGFDPDSIALGRIHLGSTASAIRKCFNRLLVLILRPVTTQSNLFGIFIGAAVPDEMQDDSTADNEGGKENKNENKPRKKKGDRLTVVLYGSIINEKLPLDEEVDILFLVSILSFQRQFAGCSDIKTNETFQRELLGVKDSSTSDDESADLEEDNVERLNELLGMRDSSSSDEESADLEEDNVERAYTSDGDALEGLNESQSRAANDFLASTGNRISIVQG